MSEQKAELIKALVAAKAEFPPIPKSKSVEIRTRRGDLIKYNYAPLDAVLAIVEPILCKHGLVIINHTTSETTVQDGIVFSTSTLYTRLWHSSGEFQQSESRLPSSADNPKKEAEAMTYYRRYAVYNLLSISPEDDNDAQNLPEQPQAFEGESRRNSLNARSAIAMKKADLNAEQGKAYLKEVWGKSSRTELTIDEYQSFLEHLENGKVKAWVDANFVLSQDRGEE